jgi:hypothetical protein
MISRSAKGRGDHTLRTTTGSKSDAARASMGASHRAAMSAMGHERPFASVEPHASFTLTNRHPRRQSARPIVKVAHQCDRPGKMRMAARR